MVVVEFSYKEMKNLIDIPREKMVDTLSEIGAPSEYEVETDKVLAELTPNRPDWYSMEGLARALKAYLQNKRPAYETKKSDYKVVVDPSVDKIRPYTACAVVKGLEFNDQRIKDVVLLQEKLLATLGRRVKRFGLGLYPLHAINFPVKYTTMKPDEIKYVPLGYEKEMTATQILKEHKKGQEHGHLIKDFDRYPVFVDVKNKIMALIPVVNSAETGKIDVTTKEIFIEVSGTSLNACNAALNILVCTFADMGGTVYEVEIDYKKKSLKCPDLNMKKMGLDIEKTNRILGTALKEKDMKKYLEKMGYEYKDGIVLIPPYRADVINFVDVVEDVAIAHGYNNFKPTIPDFFSLGEEIRTYEDIDVVLRGLGFLEISTFVLTNKEKLERVGCEKKFIEITNPNTEEYTVIRPNLLADILDVFATNKMKGLPQKLYEIGLVHEKESRKRMVFGMMDKKIEFADFRGYLQVVSRESGFGFILKKKKLPIFEDESSSIVFLDKKQIGIFGKVSKEILDKYGIGFEVYLCELEL